MTFVTVAVILSIVFVVLTLEARSRVRAAELGRLSLTERIFTTLEARRHSGSDFDPQALDALLTVLPLVSMAPELTSAPAPLHQIA